jgi:hypothetical protein
MLDGWSGGWVWCRSRVEGGCVSSLGPSECPQRGLTMGETKVALYLGAVFSTLLRVFTYIFLRVVSPFLSTSLPRCIF